MTNVMVRSRLHPARPPRPLMPSDYHFHLVVFPHAWDARRLLTYLSPMEGLTIQNLYCDDRNVVFNAAQGSGVDEYSAHIEWAKVVAHFNSSDEAALLDGQPVWGSSPVPRTG
jgi:hypothetical protein